MSFLAPDRLLFLLLPIGALIWYLVALTRRKRYAVRFSDFELLDQVAPDRPGWKRHLAAAATVMALAAFVFAFARPVMAVQVPREEATLVIVMDVSLSMDAADVDPTRIDAAKAAAATFLELAPEDLRVGVVAFAGVAVTAASPTTDHAAVAATVDRLSLAEGTAIGEGIFTGLEVATLEGEIPAALVVLSDGETTVGRSELEAAREAARLGLPVSTVSFGTQNGTIEYQGETIPVPANEGALAEVADLTGGTFTEAASAAEFQAILDQVGSDIGFETEDREVWEWFLALGLVTLVAGAASSLLWFQRLP